MKNEDNIVGENHFYDHSLTNGEIGYLCSICHQPLCQNKECDKKIAERKKRLKLKKSSVIIYDTDMDRAIRNNLRRVRKLVH